MESWSELNSLGGIPVCSLELPPFASRQAEAITLCFEALASARAARILQLTEGAEVHVAVTAAELSCLAAEISPAVHRIPRARVGARVTSREDYLKDNFLINQM